MTFKRKESACSRSRRRSFLGRVEFVTDRELQGKIWDDGDRGFFPKGIDDPKFRLIKFHTPEATFRIGGKFRTCTYK